MTNNIFLSMQASIKLTAYKTWLVYLALATVCAITSFTANAEQKITKGNWDVHYIAFNSTFLQPDIAKSYNIVRSKYSGVINISVLNTDKQNAAQRVHIKAKAKNLIGHDKNIKFKQITEGKSIYYIGQISYTDQETFKFDITVTQGDRSETLKFQQKFYAQ